MEVTNTTWKLRITHPLGRMVKDLVAAQGHLVAQVPEIGEEASPNILKAAPNAA